MAGRFRVVDTGVLEGRFNIAIDQAMIEEHQAGRIPDTFRFMRFPPTALIGRHQALRQEVDVDHCRAHGIGIVRRITGGGAIYLDEGQLGWGLVFHRKALGATVPRRAGERHLRGRGRRLAPAGSRRTLPAPQRHRSGRSQDQRHGRLLRRRHADLPGHGAGGHESRRHGRGTARAARQAGETPARLGGAARRHPARTARAGHARPAGHTARAARGLQRAIRPGLGLGAVDRGRGDPRPRAFPRRNRHRRVRCAGRRSRERRRLRQSARRPARVAP